MAEEVVLHVGLPKTGTTFLQTILWEHRDLLERRGLRYPGRRRLDHYNAFQQVRRRSRGKPVDRADAAWDRLVGELAGWSGRGLVSHEFFSMCTEEEARAVVADLAPARVRVVVTVRGYVRQFPAMWQEALKMHYDASFEQFMTDALTGDGRRLKGAWGWASQDVPAVLARWSAAVGPEQVRVVTVPPPGGPRDTLWRRWCEAVDLDPTGFDLDVTYPNESMGAAQCALLHELKPALTGPLLDGPTRHRWVRRYFGHEVLVPQGGTRFAPRPAQREALLARAREAVAAVEAGGYPVVGDLADLLDPGLPAGAAEPLHPDDVTAEQQLAVAVTALDRMIRDVAALTEERDHWRSVARRRTASGVADGVRGRLGGRAGRGRRGRRSDHEREQEGEA